MLPATLPHFDPKRLFRRLARVRRRLRLVALLQGTLALLAVLVGGAVVAGLLDWRFQLPSLVRAIALVGIVGAAGYVLIRRLLQPLSQPADNLHLALRLEEKNPELNDALASAIQFLDQPADDEASSPLLRKVAIRRAVRMAEDCNFGELISVRGLVWSALAAMLALGVALPAALRSPAAAQTALTRLLAPFGVGEWPAQTKVQILSPERWPHRQALNEPLEIRAEVSGIIPDRATLSVWFEGTPPVDSAWVIERDEQGNNANLIVRLEASKVQRDFRFRLKAGDGVTPWYEVQVLPPPELVPLEGRPSPQMRLYFPPYTDLPPRQLPDGGSSFEAAAGTNVHLRAGVNRPVARAWIVYRPEHPVQNTAAALLPLGAARPLGVVATDAAGRAVWERVPVTLSRDGTVMEATFTPRIAGVYALRFEDETGFGSTRLLDARVLADPAPAVTLDRPSAGSDSLHVTPTAVLPLRSNAADPMFAVRSVWMEYRTNKEEAPRTVSHFNHRNASRAISALAAGTPVKLRLQNVHVKSQLRIADLRRPDGSKLQENDAVIIQMLADDFDDVTGDKAPGRSHELELKIVAPATLEAMLNQEQANVRANLLRLKQWQKEAREKVADAKAQRDATGKLGPEELEKLLQAEQLQQQIRARVGNDKEGLRAEVDRIRSAQQDNQLPPSASKDRMDAVANELERLAREELEAIEPLLNNARESVESTDPMKSDSVKADPMKGDPSKTNPDKSGKDPSKAPQGGDRRKEALDEAMKHQSEVESTLSQLLQRLEPWSGANEVRGETRALLNEQEKVDRQTEKLDAELPKGPRERLEEQERADLDKAAAKQEALANQLKELMGKMDRLTKEKEDQQREHLKEAEKLDEKAQERERLAEQQKNSDRASDLKAEAQKLREQAQDQRDTAQNNKKEAEALKDAAKTARDELTQDSGTSAPQTKLHDAAKDMKDNKLGNAKQKQKESTAAMKKMLDRLEERRTDDLDRLAKKMREAEQKLDDLADKQERLQKKVKDAQQIGNPEQRQDELERLAREQEKLREEAKDLLQELSRLKADDAASALSRANRGMEDAQQRMERGEKADGAQEDALDKLDQAQQKLEQDRKQVEEELAREKAEKAAARVKALRERQESSVKEVRRVHDAALKAKKWDDAVLRSLNDQIDVERGLAEEVAALVEHQFKSIKVAAKMLEHSADAMKRAAERIDSRRKDITDRPPDEPFDPALEEKLQAEIARWQQTALRRLDQFLDALKPDNDPKQLGGDKSAGGGGGGQQPMGGGRRRSNGEEIPLLAQLKALRSLQAEVNERTAQFAKDHPDLSKLTDPEKDELESVRKTQRDVADLIQEYGIADDEPKEGGRP